MTNEILEFIEQVNFKIESNADAINKTTKRINIHVCYFP